MTHLKMTDAQFREHVVARLVEGDRRFEQIEGRQETMGDQILETLEVSKKTDKKVDGLIGEARRTGETHHHENIVRMEAIEASVKSAKENAEKTQKDVAGLVALYDGAKVVRGLAVGLKGIVVYIAGICVGVSLITAAVLSMLGKGPVPALFGH